MWVVMVLTRTVFMDSSQNPGYEASSRHYFTERNGRKTYTNLRNGTDDSGNSKPMNGVLSPTPR